jgi:hypothetical protein
VIQGSVCNFYTFQISCTAIEDYEWIGVLFEKEKKSVMGLELKWYESLLSCLWYSIMYNADLNRLYLPRHTDDFLDTRAIRIT